MVVLERGLDRGFIGKVLGYCQPRFLVRPQQSRWSGEQMLR